MAKTSSEKRFFFSTLLLSAVLILKLASSARAENTLDHAVQLEATVQKNPPQIILSWPADKTTGVTGYDVARRLITDSSWGTTTTLPASAKNYIDNQVTVGIAYEYRVIKYFTQASSTYTGYGYIYSGIEIPVNDNRGKLILLVDNTMSAGLSNELAQLQSDLVGDGWTVLRHDVLRTDKVPNIKAIVQTDYDADPTHVKSLFIVGHVPVPYSGGVTIGHTDELGAWATDTYYGVFNGAWTDFTVHSSTSVIQPFNNQPGDGKFDQSSMPGPLVLQIGRVDLYNLFNFSTPEQGLLKQYLNKDHVFRQKKMPVAIRNRGLVVDFFSNFPIPALVSPWMSLPAFFGGSLIDYFPLPINDADFARLQDPANSSLFAVGTHHGDINIMWDVVSSANFASVPYYTVFLQLSCSHATMWDRPNNLLRASLANAGPILICTEATLIPIMHYYHMALGETGGFSAWLSIENGGTLYYNADPRALRTIAGELLGDPTIRAYYVAPPTNPTAATSGSSMDVNWTASADPALGYYVYRSANASGPFTRLTSQLVTSTSFKDTSPLQGNSTYMVRAVLLQTTSAGSYFNPSQGAFASASFNGGTSPNISSVSPLPAADMGIAYAQTLTATGGTPPYTWSLLSGALPSGVTMSAAGVISGTPTVSGTFNFTAQVQDATTATDSKAFQWVVNLAPSITTVSPLASGVVNVPYSATLIGSNGTLPYTWSLANGALPAGLTLSSNGAITGTPTPTATGTANFTIQLQDNLGAKINKAFALSINATLTITSASPLPVANLKIAYSQTLTAAGGTIPYTWSVLSGALPNGITMDNAGVISGNTSKSGVFNFTVKVQDANAALDSMAFVLTANAAPTIDAGPDQTIALPNSATLSGSAHDDGLPNPPGKTTLTWTRTSGPGNVTFSNPNVASPDVSFSGAGSYVLNLMGSDGVLSANDTVTITVNPVNQPPQIDAGPDQSVTFPGPVFLHGTGHDDGFPNGALTFSWSKQSGSGAAVFTTPTALDATATFAEPGLYTLRLSGDDGLAITTDDMVVTVKPAEIPAPHPQNKNPFNPSLGETVCLSGSGEIKIYSRLGELIRVLHVQCWDGLDSKNKPAPSGVYMAVQNGNKTKLVLVRR